MNDKINHVETEIKGLKRKGICTSSINVTREIRKEDDWLRSENESWKQRNNNFTYIASDLITELTI